MGLSISRRIIASHGGRLWANPNPGRGTTFQFTLPVEASHNVFLYIYEGSAEIGPKDAAKPLPHRAAGVLSSGERVRARAGSTGVRFLLIAAKPLREPVVQYGPFVMNTREEVEQALADYRSGRLAAAA